MPIGLIKYGLPGRRRRRRAMPPAVRLRQRYDVVIVGAGGHGLAAAYYLAKDHGITDVAVLDKGWLGGGNTARNTAIIRSNYLTPEGVRFYDESIRLFRNLSTELGFNILYSERGHLTLAHNDASLRTMRWRAEVNKHLGVDSEVVDRDELARLCPPLNLDRGVRYPVLGALYHKPGAIARHDAVAWGYAVGAARRGVEIHQQTEVTGILTDKGRVTGVETTRGRIACGKVLQAVAGLSSPLAAMAGFRLPIHTVPLQACVTEPLKPFLDPIVVSGSSPRLCFPVRPRRVGDGGGDRSLRAVFAALDARIQGRPRRADAHPLPLPRRGQGVAPMGGTRGYDARFQPHHGTHPGRELLHRFRLGDLGFQGDAGLRQTHGGNRRPR